MPEQTTTMPAINTQNQNDSNEDLNTEETNNKMTDNDEKSNESAQVKPDINLYDEPKLSEIIIE